MTALADAERALKYLAETDEKYATAKAVMVGTKDRKGITESAEFLNATEGTVKDRESTAKCSEAYKQIVDKYEESVLDYELIRAKRLRAELTIEMWRSLNSAKSKGVIV